MNLNLSKSQNGPSFWNDFKQKREFKSAIFHNSVYFSEIVHYIELSDMNGVLTPIVGKLKANNFSLTVIKGIKVL
jgi:hypothetical protein